MYFDLNTNKYNVFVIILFSLVITFSALNSYALIGEYKGIVTVSSPLAIGDIDFVMEIKDINGNLSGHINTETIIVPEYQNTGQDGEIIYRGPTLNGTVNKDNRTFVLTSEEFSQEISGLNVIRRIILTGDRIIRGGDEISGTYRETIKGLIPEDILVDGTFLLSRATPQSSCTDRDGDGKVGLEEIADGGGDDMYKVELDEILSALRLFFSCAGQGNPPIDLDTILNALNSFFIGIN